MRPPLILFAACLTAAAPVFAQVTVDLHALQALPERPAAARPTRQQPQAQQQTLPSPLVPSPSVNPRDATPQLATREAPSATPQQAAPAQPAMPEAVPDVATIAPLAPPPPAGAAPPPPPVSDKATTAAAATAAGLRLTFAPGQSDLSPESADSIKQLANAATGDATTFNVSAYAPGKPDDPSTARRMSLSRAMAVRSALVADGVPSARIFVRALGEQHGDGPPDRVDVNVMGANSPVDAATPR